MKVNRPDHYDPMYDARYMNMLSKCYYKRPLHSISHTELQWLRENFNNEVVLSSCRERVSISAFTREHTLKLRMVCP